MREGLGVLLAGMALGCLYTASPSTVLFAVAAVGVCAAAVSGLEGRERRWVLRVLVLAIGLRLLVLALFVASVDHDRVGVASILGDGLYVKTRSLWLRNIWLGIPVAPSDFEGAYETYGWTGYNQILALLQVLLGPMPYGIHLVSLILYLGATVLLHRTVRQSFGPVPAIGSLAVILFMPSLFVWSISGLKESAVVFANVLGVAALVHLVRQSRRLWRIVALTVTFASVALGSALRAGGGVMIGAGLAAGLAMRAALLNLWTMVLLAAIVVGGGVLMRNQPVLQERVAQTIKQTARIHLGHVNTEGISYKLLDARFYAPDRIDPADTMTTGEGVRFVIRAMLSVVLVPLPWQMMSASQLAFLPQQILWYLLIPLALAGVVVGLQKDPLVTCLLAGSSLMGGVIVGLNSGNIGTMVRHRDMFVPFVICLGSVGATWLCARVSAPQPVQTPTDEWVDHRASGTEVEVSV